MKVLLKENLFFISKGDVVHLNPTKQGLNILFQNIHLGNVPNLNIKKPCLGVIMNKEKDMVEISCIQI